MNKPTYEELQAQIEVLREALSEAQQTVGFLSHHLRGRMGDAALMDMAEKADYWSDVLEQSPSACLAQVQAEAVEEAANELGTLITAPAGMYSGAVMKLNRIADQIRREVE